jgi:hypothetical protein
MKESVYDADPGGLRMMNDYIRWQKDGCRGAVRRCEGWTARRWSSEARGALVGEAQPHESCSSLVFGERVRWKDEISG